MFSASGKCQKKKALASNIFLSQKNNQWFGQHYIHLLKEVKVSN